MPVAKHDDPIPEEQFMPDWQEEGIPEKYYRARAYRMELWANVRKEFWRWPPNKYGVWKRMAVTEMMKLVSDREKIEIGQRILNGEKLWLIAENLRVPHGLVERLKKELHMTQFTALANDIKIPSTEKRLQNLLGAILTEMEKRLLEPENRAAMDITELMRSAKELTMTLHKVQTGDLSGGERDEGVKVVSSMPKKKAKAEPEPEESEPGEVYAHRVN